MCGHNFQLNYFQAEQILFLKVVINFYFKYKIAETKTLLVIDISPNYLLKHKEYFLSKKLESNNEFIISHTITSYSFQFSTRNKEFNVYSFTKNGFIPLHQLCI